jgi:hypothetical protein
MKSLSVFIASCGRGTDRKTNYPEGDRSLYDELGAPPYPGVKMKALLIFLLCLCLTVGVVKAYPEIAYLLLLAIFLIGIWKFNG